MWAHAGILAIFLSFLPQKLTAQDVSAPIERLQNLRVTDPELFQFISMLVGSSRPEVPGGFDWEIADSRLKCSEYFDGGFDSCVVEVDLEGESFASSDDRRNANLSIECEAELTTEDVGGNTAWHSNSDTIELEFYGGGTDRDTVSISFQFFVADPILSARISNLDCNLEGIS